MANPTIGATTPRIQYTATASQTVFTVPFEFLANADLAVYVNGTLKTLTTDYTLTGANTTGGGTLTFVTGRTAGEIVTILGNLAYSRDTNKYTKYGLLPAEVLEADFDAMQVQVKQLARDGQFALRVPLTDTGTPDMVLPAKATRATKVLGFDSDGDPVASTNSLASIESAVNIVNTIGAAPAGDSANVSYQPSGTGAVITTVQAKLRETVSVKDFGAVGDGTTNDTAAIQAALNSGAMVIQGVKGANYSITSVSMVDGQVFELNGAALTARSTANGMIVVANNCTVKNGTIDCANTQGASLVNSDGAGAGVYAVGKSGLVVDAVKFLRYRNGVFITSNVAGVYSRNHKIVRCIFDTYIWSSLTPDTGQIGIYAGASVTANNTVIGTFSSAWAEALLVSGVTVYGCYFRGGQYGAAMHRCSSFSIVGSVFEETSRGISIQTQSRDFTISGNTFINQHSTDIHMASGARNGVVVGNVCTGVKSNDNVCIQAYFGCEDIEILGNVLDSQFDQWTGGVTLDTRSPAYGIRIGQMTQRVRIARNKIRGFLEGIGIYSTIYTSILPADPNYQNSGVRHINIEDNDVLFDYEQLVASGYKSQFLKSNSFGYRIRKSLGAESSSAGAWGLDRIRVNGNKIYDTTYPGEWAYVADTSGSPVAKSNLRSRSNLASSGVGGNAEVFSGTMVATDVDSKDNTWVDSNFQNWTAFTPTFSGLTVVLGGGSVTYSGKYRKIGNTLDFMIYVVPAGGATTASTAGATVASISGFTPTDAGLCFAANASTGASIGVGVTNTTANSFVVTPTWAATANSITISGQVRL